MFGESQNRSSKKLLQHDDTGFQKLESFFSGIFGCGRDCHKFGMGPDNRSTNSLKATTATIRNVSSSRDSYHPSDVSEEDEFYQGLPSSNVNPRGKPTDNGDGNHYHKTNESYSSILDETATTQLDSFILDDSMSSSSTNDSFLLSQAPQHNQRFVRNGQAVYLQRRSQPFMVPTETVVGIWPPLPQVRGYNLRMTEQAELTQDQHWQQELEKQRHGQRETNKAAAEHEKGDPRILFPKRPPKIRRLALDHAMSSSTTTMGDVKEVAGFPFVGRNDLLPTRGEGPLEHVPYNYYEYYDCPTTAKQKIPYGSRNIDFVKPTAMCRTQSLDFLCSSSRYSNQGRESDHQGDKNTPWRQEHDQQQQSKESDQIGSLCPDYPGRLISKRFWKDACFQEERVTREVFSEMLSDLHEKHATL